MFFIWLSAFGFFVFSITFTKDVVLFTGVCFVGPLVSQQDYTKTTERISTELGWRMGLCPK